MRFDSGHRRMRWIAACLCFCGLALPARAAPLTEDDFRQIGEQGFGDRGNSYGWTMAWFKDKLYIGTNHHFACLTRSIVGGEPLENPEVPIECADNLLDMDFRGRIFSYDPATNQIELVYLSPTVRILVSDGSETDVAVDPGYRTMEVFRDKDGTEALYVGTFATAEISGPPPRILRSTDGKTFSEVRGEVLNDPNVASYRGLTTYKDRLYVIAIGRTGTPTLLLESDDPASGEFRVVNTPGFGDPVNTGIFDAAVFAGYLYVGTSTNTAGFQLLRTQAVGRPPYVFEKVLAEGAYRGSANQNVVSLHPFKNHLYIGTGINFVGLDFTPDVQPAAAELLRVTADGRWDIVCGDTRDTPDGKKEPITGLGPGCGNGLTGYIWRFAEHDGVLYMGTFDISVVPQYFEGVTFESLEARGLFEVYPDLRPLFENADPDEIGDLITAVEGGFDLWSTEDGDTWTKVSRTGFGDTYSYGVRSFVSTPVGLFLATANPFFGFRLFQGQPPGTDSDADGHADMEDNCPLAWNLDQRDTDGDGVGDACDSDDDNDCVPDRQDRSPLRADSPGPDADEDGVPDACDSDADDDGVPTFQDNCPLDENNDQADEDLDGVGDACAKPDEAPEPPPEQPIPPDAGTNGPGDGGPGTGRPATSACGAGVAGMLVVTLFSGALWLRQRRWG